MNDEKLKKYIKSEKSGDNVCMQPQLWYSKSCRKCWNHSDCVSYLRELYDKNITNQIYKYLRKSNIKDEDRKETIIDKNDIDEEGVIISEDEDRKETIIDKNDIDEEGVIISKEEEIEEKINVKKKRGRPKKSDKLIYNVFN